MPREEKLSQIQQSQITAFGETDVISAVIAKRTAIIP